MTDEQARAMTPTEMAARQRAHADLARAKVAKQPHEVGMVSPWEHGEDYKYDYIHWRLNERSATLDGIFTVKQLREIADYMEQHYRPTTVEEYMAGGALTREEAEWLASDDDSPMPASLKAIAASKSTNQ